MSMNVSELETLPGEVCAQYIRCGKPKCRCEDGERHGPYYYRIWREGEQIHKVYVKRAELAAVQIACEAHRDCRQMLRDSRKRRERLIRSLRKDWRRTEGLLRSLQRVI
jgi:uncharacterized membrane protein